MSRRVVTAFAICAASNGPSGARAADVPALAAPCASAADCLTALERFTPDHWRTMDYGDWLPARVARVGGAAAVPGLRRLLADARNDDVREAAAYTLGLLGPAARPAIPDLVRAADGDNDYAISALVNLGAPEALGAAARYAGTSDVAARALLRLGDPGLQEVRRRLRRDRDVSILIEALRDERAVIEKLAGDILLAIRLRKRADERLALADAMLRLGPPETRAAVGAAVADLRRSRNQWERDAAERILVDAGDETATRSWLANLGRRDERGLIDGARQQTICALGARAALALTQLEAVARAAATEEWEEETLAVRAIGCIRTPSAVPALIEALRSPSHGVVLTATEALERIAPAEADGALDALARQHWHPAVREAAARALAAVRGHRLPFPPKPPVRVFPPGQRFACYGETWPPVAAPTVVVDREKRGPVPPALNGIEGLTSYLAVPDGWLATRDRGEFGGGLTFAAAGGGDPLEIAPGNFHYVTGRADGFIAVAGIAHIATNRGAVWRVERTGKRFVARPWFELPSRPRGVHESARGVIVVDTDLGPLAIDPGGRISTGPCRSLSDEAAEVLQALLDDPGLRAVLAAQHAPSPLPVGLWWIEEDPRGLTYQGQPVRARRQRPAKIDAGSFLEISKVTFVPSAAEAELHFAYPDLAFFGRARFTRTNQRWRLAELRILPLEEIGSLPPMDR